MAQRRARGEGGLSSVTKNGRTVWRATKQVELWPGHPRVRIVGEGPTRAAATAALDRNTVRRLVKAGQLPPERLTPTHGETPTVRAYCEEWLDANTTIRATTRKQYANTIRLHIGPLIGDIPLTVLTTERVERFLTHDLTAPPPAGHGLGPSAVKTTYQVLNATLDRAVVRKKILGNPIAAIDKKARPKSPKRSREENQKIRQLKSWAPENIAKVVTGRPDEARWLLALCALRQGEALGITLDNLKMNGGPKKARLDIVLQLQHQNYEHGCGDNRRTGKWNCGRQSDYCPQRRGRSGWLLTLPKNDDGTSDARSIPLPQPLYGALKRVLKQREEWAEQPEWQPLEGLENLLFTTPTGRPIRAQDDSRAWHQLLKEAKVPDLRLHDARHLTASRLTAEGVTPATIQAVGGWNDAKTMANYTHAGTSYLFAPMETYLAGLEKRRKPTASNASTNGNATTSTTRAKAIPKTGAEHPRRRQAKASTTGAKGGDTSNTTGAAAKG